MEGLDVHTRLQVLMALAQLHTAHLTGRTARRLSELAEEGESLAEGIDDPLVAFMWAYRGSTSCTIAAYAEDADFTALAVEWMEIGVAMSARFAVPWQLYARLCAGMGYTTLRRAEDAERHLEAAVGLPRLEGYDAMGDTARGYLSVYRVLAGDAARALALVEGITPHPNAPSFFGQGALSAVAARAASGDAAGARRQLAASYRDALRADISLGVEEVLVFGAAIAGLCESWDSAARLLAASGEGWRRSPFSYMLYLTFRDRVRAAVGVDRAREAPGRGTTPVAG